MKLRVLIAEDESLSRERLRQFLETETLTEIVAECVTGQEALKAIQQTLPDIVFLDVKMPDLDGFSVIEGLSGAHPPVIIFVTAYDRFALRAFEVHAADFLLKPFDRDRFQKALWRARDAVRRNREHHALEKIANSLAALKVRPKSLGRFAVKSRGRVVFVKTDEIEWIRGAHNYSELHAGKSVHFLRQTLATLEHQLLPNQFMRISRSLLVNLDRIKEIRPKTHGDYLVIMQDGKRLTASRNYRKDLKLLLDRES
jgi:two-component system LytT family response regulator